MFETDLSPQQSNNALHIICGDLAGCVQTKTEICKGVGALSGVPWGVYHVCNPTTSHSAGLSAHNQEGPEERSGVSRGLR